MESLLRTRAGSFDLADAHRLEEIEQAVREGRLSGLFLPLDTPFRSFPKGVVSEALTKTAENGGMLPVEGVEVTPISAIETSGIHLPYDNNKSFQISEENNTIFTKNYIFRLYLSDGRFAGIYLKEDSHYRLKKIFL